MSFTVPSDERTCSQYNVTVLLFLFIYLFYNFLLLFNLFLSFQFFLFVCLIFIPSLGFVLYPTFCHSLLIYKKRLATDIKFICLNTFLNTLRN